MNESYETIALSPLRRAIASRMAEAKRTIPHFRVSDQIEVDELINHKAILQVKTSAKLSLTHFLIKICADSLLEVPGVNLQWAEEGLHRFRNADVALIVAVPGGLVTPVIRAAESKS